MGKIIVPAEKLAKAVDKWLKPGVIRKVQAEQAMIKQKELERSEKK